MKTLMLNQKAGLTYKEIETYVTKTKIYAKNFVIFPSNIYINKFVESGFNVGSQNIASSSLNNQTGEITGSQLKSIGVKHVIIGHSERRQNQNENKDILIKKFNEAINNGLNIVYCVGETLVEYKVKETYKVILKELDEVLSKIDKNKIKELYIAYEPIWAIGSGLTPNEIEIKDIIRCIKNYINNKNINAKVLYGGSVNEKNIESLSKIEILDGFLVGGASNSYEKTINMCEILMNSTK